MIIGILLLGAALVIALSSLGLAVILWVRNNRVYEFRRDLLNRISTASRDDIRRGDYDWERRYDAFNAVSYDKMFWRFWQPLSSFYPDASFTEPSST